MRLLPPRPAKAMSDSLTVFDMKKPDWMKMEASINSFKDAKLTAPIAYKVVFFRERAIDFVRFAKLDDLVLFIGDSDTGYWCDNPFQELSEETMNKRKHELVQEVIEASFQMLCKNITTAREGTAMDHQILGQLSGKLVAQYEMLELSLYEPAVEDLRLAVDAFDNEACQDACETAEAIKKIIDRSAKPAGILMPILRDTDAMKFLDTRVAGITKAEKPQDIWEK